MVETRRLSTNISICHHLIFPCQIILLARLLTLTMGIFDCRYRFTTSLTRKGKRGNLFINTLSIEMHSFLFEIPTGTMSKKVFLYAQSRYFPNHKNMPYLHGSKNIGIVSTETPFLTSFLLVSRKGNCAFRYSRC